MDDVGRHHVLESVGRSVGVLGVVLALGFGRRTHLLQHLANVRGGLEDVELGPDFLHSKLQGSESRFGQGVALGSTGHGELVKLHGGIPSRGLVVQQAVQRADHFAAVAGDIRRRRRGCIQFLFVGLEQIALIRVDEVVQGRLHGN